MTTLNTIIEEEKEWKCIGHTEYGDKISLDGHSYIEVPTDYIKQVRREERAKIWEEVERQMEIKITPPPTLDKESYQYGWHDGLLNFRSGFGTPITNEDNLK